MDTFDVGEDETTGKLSASYKIPGTGARIRGAVGEGVKRPSFAELLDVYGPGNPNLKSERQRSWEAGFDQFLADNKIKFSATYYVNDIDDLIAYSFTPFENGTNYENIQKARVKGAELSFSLLDFTTSRPMRATTSWTRRRSKPEASARRATWREKNS